LRAWAVTTTAARSDRQVRSQSGSVFAASGTVRKQLRCLYARLSWLTGLLELCDQCGPRVFGPHAEIQRPGTRSLDRDVSLCPVAVSPTEPHRVSVSRNSDVPSGERSADARFHFILFVTHIPNLQIRHRTSLMKRRNFGDARAIDHLLNVPSQ
jgi:hypothetical protein